MLRKKTFQNKVAASRYSLPITATLATLVWVAVGLLVSNIWVEFAFTAMSTLLMVELNNLCPDAYLQPNGILQFSGITDDDRTPPPLFKKQYCDDVFHRLLSHYLELLSG